MTIRYAIRSQGGGAFTEYLGPTTSNPALGLSYTADRQAFLLTYADHANHTPYFVTIDPATGSQLSVASDTLRHPHMLADSACAYASSGYCLTAEATGGVNGPILAWFQGSVSPSRTYGYSGERNCCYYSWDLSSITRDNRTSGSLGYFGSFNQNDVSTWVYRMTSPSANPQDLVAINTGYYPVSVGSQTKNNSAKIIAYYAN
jgi:hypothetical protein